MKTVCSDKASMAVSPNRGKISEEQRPSARVWAQKRDVDTVPATSPEFMATEARTYTSVSRIRHR